MSDVFSSESTLGQYSIRRFWSDDAAGVTRLVEGVYGDTYYPRNLYNPDEIVHLNEAEKLVSVVAVDSAGQVIGHYAPNGPIWDQSRRPAMPLWQSDTGIITFSKRCGRCCAKKENASA